MVAYNLEEKHIKVEGDINRINRYGNTSYCMKTQLLRKYCYCI